MSVSGTVYSWTNTNTSIGLGASGAGDIPSFTTLNTTNTAQVATIVVTPSYTNAGVTCTGSPQTFTITVNPTPDVADPTDQVLCVGSSSSVTFTSPLNVSGTVYTWANDNTNTGLGSGSTGNISSFTTTNVTNAPIVSNVTVTPSYTNAGVTCTGSPQTFTITVNPTPIISNISQTLCTGSPMSVAPVHGNGNTLPLGTLYTWTVSPGAVTGSSASATQAAFPVQTLTNPTNAAINVTYTFTPYYTNNSVTCTGSTFTDIVTVGPTMTIPTQTAAVCSGETFLVTPANGIAGSVVPSTTQYSWSAPSVTGITVANPGSGVNASGISGTLSSTNSTSTLVTYVVTPSVVVNGNTCNGTAFNVVVNVLTGSPAVAVGANQTICGNTTASLVANVQDAQFGSWATTGSGVFAPNVTNTTTIYKPSAADATAGSVLLIYTATNGCGTNSDTLLLTINAAPTTNAGTDVTICNGQSTTLVATGATSYSWSPNTGLSATNTASVAANPSTTTTYTVTGTTGTCTRTDEVTVTVNPTPAATIAASASTICIGGSVTLTANSGS